MNIAVAGAGYVGTSLAVLFAQNHTVHLVDIDPEKIALLESGVSPVTDKDIDDCLAKCELNLIPTCDIQSAYAAADLVIIAVPTDYDPDSGLFNTSAVENVVETVIETNPSATIVIKSTVPMGYTDDLATRYPNTHLFFSPEFLREGKALYDNLHPSRIVLGIPACYRDNDAARYAAKEFVRMLADAAHDADVPTLITGAAEAEAIKLFSNTFLAMRVAFFNELDTYADVHKLDVNDLVKGVCLDPRIGNFYNNPSFGYGGYCLPKDTKQLLANYRDIPQSLMSAIVSANRIRKDYVAHGILERITKLKAAGLDNPVVGIYRLSMKTGSDNMRSSSVLGVMKRLAVRGVPMVVYAPLLKEDSFMGSPIIGDLAEFKQRADVIVANRTSEDLLDVSDKVYTRDLFGDD